MTDILFNRDFVVQVGATRIHGRQPGDEGRAKPTLRIIFKVEKDNNRDPNIAEVKIYNLSEPHRKALEKKQPLTIEAGYTSTMQHLFYGDITYVSHVLEGVNWITTVQCGDGAEKFGSARINISFGGGTKVKSMLKAAAEALGVGLGNAFLKADDDGNNRKLYQEVINGAVHSGAVNKVLDRICASAGFQWSIQDGQLQLLRTDETSDEESISLSFATGLVGSPEVGEEGIVKARSLLQGGLKPNRKLEIKSRMINGFFRIESVTHSGDTWGQDWYSEIEAKPL